MDDWGFPFKSSPKVGRGTAKQQVKNEKWIKKREKSDIQRFQCQAVVFFDIGPIVGPVYCSTKYSVFSELCQS